VKGKKIFFPERNFLNFLKTRLRVFCKRGEFFIYSLFVTKKFYCYKKVLFLQKNFIFTKKFYFYKKNWFYPRKKRKKKI